MKRIISISAAFILLLSLCACGNAKQNAEIFYDSAPSAVSYDYNYDYAMAEASADYSAVYSAKVAGAPVPMPAASNNASHAGGDTGSDNLRPEKIIYSASATVETTDFDATLKKLDDMIGACGGFVESSSSSDNSYYRKSRGYSGGRSASYTIRVPGEVFGDVMSGLSALGNIPYSSTNTRNVTSQYYDTQARLDAYRAQELRLLELMEKAETVDDIITIEERLTDIRYSIDSMQSQLINYDRKVSFSTIELTIEEVEEYTPTPTEKPGFGKKLVKAASNGISGAVEFLEDIVLWLAEALPTLIILAVFAVIALIPCKKAVKKLKARRAAKKSKSE